MLMFMSLLGVYFPFIEVLPIVWTSVDVARGEGAADRDWCRDTVVHYQEESRDGDTNIELLVT